MSTIFADNRCLKVIHRSRNLRGIMDHARRTAPTHVCVNKCERGEADIMVFYSDGSVGTSHFASFDVCVDWVHNRHSWGMKVYRNEEPTIAFEAA